MCVYGYRHLLIEFQHQKPIWELAFSLQLCMKLRSSLCDPRSWSSLSVFGLCPCDAIAVFSGEHILQSAADCSALRF